MTHRRARINLAAQMLQREYNYLRLMALMPNWQEQDSFEVCCLSACGNEFKLVLRLLARSTYTLVVSIEQQLDQDKLDMRWLQNIQVRVYLDAKSAEVIACNGKRLPNWCACANQRTRHLLVKMSCDGFLGELLSFWLGHGLVPANRLALLFQTDGLPAVDLHP